MFLQFSIFTLERLILLKGECGTFFPVGLTVIEDLNAAESFKLK